MDGEIHLMDVLCAMPADSKWRVEIAGPGRKFHPTKWYLGLYESEEQVGLSEARRVMMQAPRTL